jgi:preprotein translocase subunit SecA
MVSKAIQQTQVKVESFHFDARKRLVDYDDVLNKQREIIYRRRDKVLTSSLDSKNIKKLVLDNIESEIRNLITVYSPEGFDALELDKVITDFASIVPFDTESQQEIKKQLEDKGNNKEIINLLMDIVKKTYEAREETVGSEKMREIEKFVSLNVIDKNWMDHLTAIDDLREGIGLRGYGQLDPLVEYKKEAFSMFEELMANIDYEINRRIFRVQIDYEPKEVTANIRLEHPDAEINEAIEKSRRPQSDDDPAQSDRYNPKTGEKIGRNDPCWCGSGKKWKKCCYPETPPG